MRYRTNDEETRTPERYELRETSSASWTVDRREFLEIVGAGLVIATTAPAGVSQRATGNGNLEARLHIGEDGTITVLTGKVEEGQGPRTELTMAAAEELGVPLERVKLVMADTEVAPNDGITAGSRTTPGTVPPVRKAAAAAHELLLATASGKLNVDRSRLAVRNGVVKVNGGQFTYADLARSPELAAAYREALPPDIHMTPAESWQTLGTPHVRVNGRDIVTGTHRYPSDIVRPGMLYGCVLRPPSYGATLESVDVSAARNMPGVIVVHDGEFVGCVAETSFMARKAIQSLSGRTKWKLTEQPCGAILNPANLRSQVEGAIMMGLGPALREHIGFREGYLTNGSFAGYKVPRFKDVPKIDVILLDRKDIEPAGAGETPIMALAPAMTNAMFAVTGKRTRSMPLA